MTDDGFYSERDSWRVPVFGFLAIALPLGLFFLLRSTGYFLGFFFPVVVGAVFLNACIENNRLRIIATIVYVLLGLATFTIWEGLREIAEDGL